MEETDETLFWFELLVEAELAKKDLAEPLMKECQELLFRVARDRQAKSLNHQIAKS